MAINVQVVEAFLRQPPPRHIPGDLQRRALRRFPMTFALIGVLVLLVDSMLAPVFFPRRLPDDIRLNRRGVRIGNAAVLACRRTNMSENNRRIFEYTFEYTPADGQKRKGCCYSSTRVLSEGAAVNVEYLPDQPDIARIEGCRLSPFGWGAIFIVLAPVAGIVFTVVTLHIHHSTRWLLRHGLFAVGQIAAIEKTLMTVNNKPVYRVRVSYRTEQGTVSDASYRVFTDEALELARRKQASGEVVGVLYDPAHPQRLLVVDELLV